MPNAFDRNEPNLPAGARDVLATIRLHGWAYAPADDHAHSTGFGWSVKAPEVIVCGQPGFLARDLLTEAYRQIKGGQRFEAGKPYDGFLDDCPVYFQTVEKREYDTYLGWGVWFYGDHDFACQQMIVPDSTGLFPWQAGFDPAETQPDLSAGNWAGQVMR